MMELVWFTTTKPFAQCLTVNIACLFSGLSDGCRFKVEMEATSCTSCSARKRRTSLDNGSFLSVATFHARLQVRQLFRSHILYTLDSTGEDPERSGNYPWSTEPLSEPKSRLGKKKKKINPFLSQLVHYLCIDTHFSHSHQCHKNWRQDWGLDSTS